MFLPGVEAVAAKVGNTAATPEVRNDSIAELLVHSSRRGSRAGATENDVTEIAGGIKVSTPPMCGESAVVSIHDVAEYFLC